MYSDYFRLGVSGEIVRNSGISNNWSALKHYQIPFRTLPAHCWPRCKTSTTRKKNMRACEIYMYTYILYYMYIDVIVMEYIGDIWWPEPHSLGDLTEDEVRIPGLQWLMFNPGRVVEIQRLIDPSEKLTVWYSGIFWLDFLGRSVGETWPNVCIIRGRWAVTQ